MTQASGKADSEGARIAKAALENVCSGTRLDCIGEHYGPDFVDHVNDSELLGHAGVRASVAAYRRILADLKITVQDQVVAADRVANRFIVTGTAYGRAVSFNGITISRLEGGLIVEDWSVTDTMGMLRQLGLWRSFRVLVRSMSARTPAAQRG